MPVGGAAPIRVSAHRHSRVACCAARFYLYWSDLDGEFCATGKLTQVPIDPILVLCFEGLLETEHPFVFVARQVCMCVCVRTCGCVDACGRVCLFVTLASDQ